MPVYQVYRLKDNPRQQFRWQPHTSGISTAKPKDYEKDVAIEAASVYSVWDELRRSERALEVGDILEAEDGTLQICKYIGFEEARWFVPEPAPAAAEVL